MSGQEIDPGGVPCLCDAGGPGANAARDAQRTRGRAGTACTLNAVWGRAGFERRLGEAERWCRSLRSLIAAFLLLIPCGALPAQRAPATRAASDSMAPATIAPVAGPRGHPPVVRWLGGAAIVAASAALDRPLRDAAGRIASRDADRVADALDPFGRARYLLPALASAWLIPRLTGHDATADAALRVALGYLAADAVESVLKPAVGRHRPTDGGGPWRFEPLRNGTSDWHSFPSAHTVHAFSIASTVAVETDRAEVAVGAYTLASLVGAQRVYTRAHWTSDVVVSTALGIGASTITARWVRRHGIPGLLRPVRDQPH